MRRRHQGRRLRLRHRAGRRRARQGRLRDVLRGASRRRRAPRARSRAGAAIYVLNGLLPGTAAAYAAGQLAAGDGQRARNSTNGPRSAPRPRGSAARPSQVDTGMNRLGFGIEEAAALAQRRRTRPRHRARDEPFRRRGRAEHPLNAKQMGLFRDVRALFPGIPGLACQLVGDFPRARRASRHGAARRRALWRQPDARACRIRCARSFGCKGASCRCAMSPKARRSDTARPGPPGATRLAVVSVGYADGFMRAAGATNLRPARTRSSRAGAVRSPGAFRWICWPST